jgi:hypothetical protein
MLKMPGKKGQGKVRVFSRRRGVIADVIKSIITTKAFTEIIAAANSVNEVATGSYGQFGRAD